MNDPRAAGEFGLIDWIRRNQADEASDGVLVGIGDDCAIVDFSPESFVLVTTDMLMDGRHFQLKEDGPEAVGYKAMGVNLSDIAAMAGSPRFAVVGVALPRSDAFAVAQGLHAGLKRMADRFGVVLVGGDTNAWDGPLVVSVTLLGEPTALGAATRSGAQAGDLIFVTGPLGGSLFKGRHLRPEPRIREALIVAEAASPTAMIDVSDGLSSDLGHILKESGGLGALLEEGAIPIHPDALAHAEADGVPGLEHALHDGEDFELCLTVAPERAERLLAEPPAGVQLHRIGEVVAAPGVRLRHRDGSSSLIEPRGFDHLSGRNP